MKDLRSDTIEMIETKEALSNLSREKALEIVLTLPEYELFSIASRLREAFRGRKVDLCSIVNAKSGGCSEDCAYCAQSARYPTEAEVFPLLSTEQILEAAISAKENGAKRFCVVTSGRKPSPKELDRIAGAIGEIKKTGLMPCATLGILTKQELQVLKEAGLYRYHHNLETSERFFPRVCTTHSYRDKIATIEAAKEVGLSVCSGGLFGLGESWQDRIDMAFTLKSLEVDSVPINFLIPIKGTPMQYRQKLHPFEALRIVAIYRLIMPERQIRICGGRFQTLGPFNSMVFMAGADGLLIGNYLTQRGCSVEEDWQIIRAYGLEV